MLLTKNHASVSRVRIGTPPHGDRQLPVQFSSTASSKNKHVERLCRDDGALSDRTLAQRLIRRLQAEAAGAPGARFVAACAPAVAAAAAPLAAGLAQQVGARFEIRPDPACSRERLDVGQA